MKKLAIGIAAVVALIGGPALAADMAVKAPTVPTVAPAPVSNWTGAYVGGSLGWGWSNQNWTLNGGFAAFTNDPLGSGNRDGFLGGIQGGYNFQFSPSWVAGIQADFTWSNITGNVKNTAAPDGRCFDTKFVSDQSADCAATTRSFGTLTAKLGYLPIDNLMIYAKGGLAWVNTNYGVTNDIDISGGTCGPVGTTHPNYNTTRQTYSTGTAGGGAELRVTSNMTVFGEYDWIGGHNSTVNMTNPSADPCVANFSSTVNLGAINIFKFGANYQFH